MIDSVNETSATTKKLPLVEQWKQFFRQSTLLEKSYYRFILFPFCTYLLCSLLNMKLAFKFRHIQSQKRLMAVFVLQMPNNI